MSPQCRVSADFVIFLRGGGGGGGGGGGVDANDWCIRVTNVR